MGTTTDNGARLQVAGNQTIGGTLGVTGVISSADVTGLKYQLNGTAGNYYGIEKQAAVAGGDGSFKFEAGKTSAGEFIFSTGGTQRLLIASTGAATFSSSVTATSFFESSDSRLKTLIKDDYRALGIESVKARLYLKEGKEEIGYYAQDLESILPSAVSKNDAGFLSLSYTQVHTVKIAIIEDEVDVLKRRVYELEKQLKNK